MGEKETVELYETIYGMFDENEKTMMLVSLLQLNFEEDTDKIMEFLHNMKRTYKNLNN